MSVWAPRLSGCEWRVSVLIAVAGAACAGVYGAVHDQASFAISPEYFTQAKFKQFAWADRGLPPRLFASVIGALASWWVGLIAGWVLARLGLTRLWLAGRRRALPAGFAIVATTGIAFAVAGVTAGRLATADGDLAAWAGWRRHGVTDLPAFVTVAWLHWASYLGAIAGTLVAAACVRRWRRRELSG